MPASADRRAQVQRARTRAIRMLPPSVANTLRKAKARLRSGREPEELANLRTTVAGAIATNEAGVVGLSQELARLADRVDQLQSRQDELTALIHEQAAQIAALTPSGDEPASP